ncbi:MAG: hypothetical protein RJQ09_14845 [Cyclobacteriaceae bacterium]
MELNESIFSSEPLQYVVFIDCGFSSTDDSFVRTERPGIHAFRQIGYYRIVMNIEYQPTEISIVSNFFSFELVLEKGASSIVFLVDGLSIRNEEIPKRFFWWCEFGRCDEILY